MPQSDTFQNISVSSTGGHKQVKPERHSLIPTYPLAEVARVYEYGSRKYADHNWRKGYEWSKSYDALQRHIQAFWGGEDYDIESGLPHVAHAVFHLFALLQGMEDHPEFDDRYTPVIPAPSRVTVRDWEGNVSELPKLNPTHPYSTGLNDFVNRVG
jgi:hypothetical protein